MRNSTLRSPKIKKFQKREDITLESICFGKRKHLTQFYSIFTCFLYHVTHIRYLSDVYTSYIEKGFNEHNFEIFKRVAVVNMKIFMKPLRNS